MERHWHPNKLGTGGGRDGGGGGGGSPHWPYERFPDHFGGIAVVRILCVALTLCCVAVTLIAPAEYRSCVHTHPQPASHSHSHSVLYALCVAGELNSNSNFNKIDKFKPDHDNRRRIRGRIRWRSRVSTHGGKKSNPSRVERGILLPSHPHSHLHEP